MARPTWTLTGPLSAPHGAVLAGTELTLSLVTGVSRDPSGSDLRAGSTVAVVGADGTLTVKGTGDPVMLLASSPDAPVHYRLSCIPRVLPTVTFTAPEGGTLALDDIVPEVPAPIPPVDASTLRAEWQAALDGKQPAGSYAAGVHTHPAAQITDATTAGRALVTAADAAAQRTALGLGSAATTAATDYATAAQGALADTAVQPAALAAYAPIRGIGSEFAALGAELALAQRSTAVQIIGDSTGNATDEWVHLTAQWLAAAYPTHRVEHRVWDSTSQDYLAPVVIQAGPSGERYLLGDGVARAVCVPDSAANSITGDVDIRVDVSLNSWSQTATENVFVSKFAASGQRTLRFWIGGGYNKPHFEWSANGSTLIDSTPTTWTTPVDGTRKWLRVTLDVDNGASGRTVRFYDSTDGVTWTQIGADVTTAGVTSLFDSTSEWQAGARGGSVAGGTLFSGKLYQIEVRNGISGPMVLPAKPEAWPTQRFNPVYGGSPTVTFVNGSHPGADLTYLLDPTRFSRMTPDYGQALSIVSCSHNDSWRTGTAYLADWDTMLANLRAKFPLSGVVASTQNPETAPAASIREHAIRAAQILGWASRNRVGVIDAYRAFIEDSRDIAALVSAVDGVHPTAAGSQVWSEAAQSALTGR